MNKNIKKGLINFMQVVAFGALLLVIIGFSMLPNRAKLAAIEEGEPKFDKLTIETVQQSMDFKIRTLSEKYDKKGDLSYDVVFENSDGQRFRIYCNIPESYKDKLNKEATYSGSIKLAYVKELYQDIKDEAGNKIEMTDENCFTVVCKNSDAYALIEVDFMYKSFVTNSIPTIDEVTKDFNIKYTEQQNTAS